MPAKLPSPQRAMIPHLLFALLATAWLAGCAGNPATGGADIVLTSERGEIAEGRKMHEEIMKSNSAYPDEKVQAYVNRLGQNLAKHSDRPDLEYHFTVIDSENINAFALPGGYIYVNRGLMSYLDSEAELAGVISHEIGHVTARHSVRQKTAAATNTFMAQLTYMLTGSADLAASSNMAGMALVRGYGREHELEADSEGAEYLYNAGYDPTVLLDVIGVLKDQETYNRIKAKQSGKQPQTYHGLFSTHPRNDQRLQEVISTARSLEQRPPAEEDPAGYRSIINGLTYGKRAQESQREEGRYYHNKLNFTFAHPADWTVNAGSRAIVASPGDDSAKVTITIQRKDEKVNGRQLIGEKLEAPTLQQPAALEQEKLQGLTGISPANAGNTSRRLAVIYYGRLAYLFESEVSNEADFSKRDAEFLALIESFRGMKKSERPGTEAKHIVYIQAAPDMTYAQLAKESKIPDAENQLRLLNGQYPRGEPRAGDWIKIVR